MLKYYVALQNCLASRKSKKGQSLAEYGLILALIAIVCMVGLQTLGTNINSMLSELAGQIGG